MYDSYFWDFRFRWYWSMITHDDVDLSPEFHAGLPTVTSPRTSCSPRVGLLWQKWLVLRFGGQATLLGRMKDMVKNMQCMVNYLVRYPNLTPHLVLMLFLISSIVRLVRDFAAFAFFSPSNPRKYCSMKGRSFLDWRLEDVKDVRGKGEDEDNE